MTTKEKSALLWDNDPKDTPDKSGWYAFQGSEWESKPIWPENYDPNEDEEEWCYRTTAPIRYEDVKGEPFQTVVEVRWVQPGQAISTRKHAGPHSGEPVLGFVSPKYHWNHALYGIDTWTGKWWYLQMPWSDIIKGGESGS